MTIDPASTFRAFPPPGERFDVAVVGGGRAGCAEAIAAAYAGASVLLVDENPVPPGLMGLDVPLRYGARATAAIQRPDRMLEQIAAAEPLIAEAFEAGVDVRLGVAAWGAWAPGPANRALPQPLLGIASEAECWMVGFGQLVVAAGARDLALGFAGSDLPGVVGANGLHALLTRYDAFSGRRVVVVGSGGLAEETAAMARGRGLDVAEIVSLADGWAPLRAEGAAEVEGLTLVRDDGERRTVACDTICLAVGRVPVVELPAVLGCALTFDPARGGHVPILDADGRSSLPFVRVAGDAAGVAADDRMAWMDAMRRTGGADAPVCLCEEVSRGELLGVRPPRYLNASEGGQSPLDHGVGPHPDHLKRLTRAGMGVCQGRRCREQIAMLLALDGGIDLARVPLASYRIPLRPLPMAALAGDEPEHVSRHWPIWFDISEQWTHYLDIAVSDS